MTRVGLSPLAWLDTVEQQRRQAGLRRSLRTRPAVATELDLASNDYLGLSQHPAVIDGGVAALRTWGAGSTGSRLVTGNTELHEEFEAALAEFVGAEAALVFSSGYTANIGATVALSGPGSLVVSDALSHASLVDACRLSRARVVVAPHCDVDAVEAALADRDEERALVITESVFSTDGALAPLRQLHEVCRRHRAVLLVDEAHGLGVRGVGGRGLIHEAGLAGAPDVVMTTTMSKSLGSQGGVVLGPAAVRDHLIDAARTMIFDTGLAPAPVGAALAALTRAGRRAGAGRCRHRAGPAARRDVRRPRNAGIGGGFGHPRRSRDRGGRGDRLPGRRCAGGLLPPADGARGHLAAATDRTGVADRRRDGHRPRCPVRGSGYPPAMSVLVITGTGTGVGKTVATAALACHARVAERDVAVCKPVQTGTADGDDDLAEVARLSGVTELVGVARYPEPLAPAAAAERAGLPLPSADELLASIRGVDRPGRLTLVEGAGGLLVELAAGGVTLRDLAEELAAPVLVVVEPGLGTLNHTSLTLEGIGAKGLSCAGLVIGAWPAQPGAAEKSNRDALARLAPVRAALPAGVAAVSPKDFALFSARAFDPDWVAGLI